MKLYRPVKITSTDLPMDKFPEGTIATHPDYWPVERCSCSRWESEGGDRYDPDMVGWTALVPIEAEEEWIDNGNFVINIGEGDATPADVDDYERRNGSRPSRRLVTSWEEA